MADPIRNPVPAWVPTYIGLGSNLNDPPAQLRRATIALAGLSRTVLVAVSRQYRNPPMGPQDQPFFVNAVAGLLTQLPPQALLGHLKAIETAHGRERTSADRWGPRILDLDLLVYGTLRLDEHGLTVPHPGITDRNFVLFPLLEIAPGLHIPGHGQVGKLAMSLDGTSLEILA